MLAKESYQEKTQFQRDVEKAQMLEKTHLACRVSDEDDRVCSSVVRVCDSAISFLPSRVPLRAEERKTQLETLFGSHSLRFGA